MKKATSKVGLFVLAGVLATFVGRSNNYSPSNSPVERIFGSLIADGNPRPPLPPPLGRDGSPRPPLPPPPGSFTS
jgi:hypothetical protein